MMYALFNGDKQVSKAHAAKEAVIVEAFEMGAVISHRFGQELVGGYEIRELEEKDNG